MEQADLLSMCFVEGANRLRCRLNHDLAVLLGKVGLCLRGEPHIALLARTEDEPPAPLFEHELRLVAKLKGARDRVRKKRGKCEGRKAHVELNPEAVALAKRLHRASPKTGERMSLRRISAELKAAGYVNEHGREFNPNSIKSMVERSRI